MKKFFLILLLSVGSTFVFAQSQINVPTVVHQAFKTAHNTHDFITWEMEGVNYKASSIDQQGVHHITVYDAYGDLVRAESELTGNQVPEPIVNYMNAKFPPNTKYNVWSVDSKDGKRTYYSDYNNTIIRFDGQGNEEKN